MEAYEKLANDLQKKAGKDFVDMTDSSFNSLMESQSKGDLEQVRLFLVANRDFYKRVLQEEYRKTHPNSFRYLDSEEQIGKLNNKGKLLKLIIDKK